MGQSAAKDSKLRAALKRSAVARGYTPGSERYNRYVYGGMNAVLARSGKGGKKGG
jgi:hypothetical protein